MLSSFVRTQHSLFRTYPKVFIRGKDPQGSISVPQVYIGGFFESSIETTNKRFWSRPDSTIAPVTTRDVTKTIGLGITHLDVTIHQNSDTRQSISKTFARQTSQIPESSETQQFPSQDASVLRSLQNKFSWVHNSFIIKNNVTCNIGIHSKNDKPGTIYATTPQKRNLL